MNWICLILAGCCEMGFTFCLGKLKGVEGSVFATWMTVFVLFYFMSMVFLLKATQTIPVGTAYPVFTGIGAVGSVLIGIFFFGDPATFWRLFFITTLIISIIGLKMV